MPSKRHIGTLAVLVALAVWAMARRTEPVPEVTSGAGCLRCHDIAAEGPAGLHASFPCESCHLGDPEGTTVLTGHDGMVLESGALDVVDRTCGLCHMREVDRVRTSPMATARGLVSVNRWAFGEIPTPDDSATVMDVLALEDPTPAQDHLRRLCLGCHLNTRRDNRDDAIHPGEGSGCSACHTGPKTGEAHSSLGGEVPDQRCFGCHSRSARISLTYQGLAEVSGPWEEACPETSFLPDGRTVCAIPADVHHEAGMACTDCHLHTELMGDGETYLHEGDAVELTCAACHGPDPDERVWNEVQDSITDVLLHVNIEWRPDDEAVRVGRRGTPIWNLRPRGDSVAPWMQRPWVLTAKSDGRPMPVTQTPRDLAHTLTGHERLSCASCHAATAPTCPTCHTTFDADDTQWDFAAGAVTPGRWIETNEGMGFEVPGLALGPDGRIRPAVPGMTGTLDARNAGGSLAEIHLFSVLDPHNTVKEGRPCASCHVEAPQALEVVYPSGTGTRVGARGLNAAERSRVARVAPCLECHDGTQAWFDSFALLVPEDGPALRRLPVCREVDGGVGPGGGTR